MKTYTFHVSQPGGGRVWRKIELSGDQTLEELHFAIQDAYDWDADHLYSFFMSGRAWDSSSEYCLPEDADPWGLDLDDEDEEIGDEAEDDEIGKALVEEISPDAVPAEMAALGITPEALQQALITLNDDMLTDDEKLTRVGPLANTLWDYLTDLDDSDLAGDVRETTLDQLELKVGRKFLYIFDYGDEHRFQVRVHAVNPDAPDDDYPRIVESVGEAPEQYPSWDEEEEEEDDEEDDVVF
jgi:hypothetical protein